LDKYLNVLDNFPTIKYNLVVDKKLYYYFAQWRIYVNTQYKKGVLELCVLALLEKRDCYGYEISEYLSNHIDIADGTVYPILRKLKNDGVVSTYLQEESGGPPRKYYSLTKLGREAYKNDRAEYLNFARAVKTLLEDDNHDKE
jgi:PadR family transcriptional regulator PadR